jgi:cysteine synthase
MNGRNSLLSCIGKTPLVRLRSVVGAEWGQVWCKLEYLNPSGSSKDRMVLAIVEAMEQEGSLRPGDSLIEASCGNTAVSLAMIAAAKGYPLRLVMPDSIPLSRRQFLAAYGADIILTPALGGMKASVRKALELMQRDERIFMINQFDNPANPRVHRLTTGPEILEELGRAPDVFVAGVGTGGTLTGVGEAFKAVSPRTKVVAVEPAESPILSGGNPGPHKIAGIGAGFVPKVLNTEILDQVEVVTYQEALATVRVLAECEGIYAGLSSGAAVCASLRQARRLGPEEIVLTILCDSGERYVSFRP